MNDNNNAISVNNLVKRFDDFVAVDNISFNVKRGEIFGFLGPNGSGKTTTIRMMLGILTPSEGSIDVLGIPVLETPEKIRQRVGYMSQRFSLYNDLSVIQNLNFYGRAYGINNSELKHKIKDALHMSGLVGKEKIKTKDLAGGWRQRLALSVAILHNPEVIFLDEPTAGVDPVSRRVFWDLLYSLVLKGVTIFVTTHYMDEAEHCQRLAFIQDGKLIAYGSTEDIRKKANISQVLEISPSNSAKAIKVLENAKKKGKIKYQELELYGSLIHIFSKNGKESKKQILPILKNAGITIDHSAIIEPSLEDVFIFSMKK